MNLILFGAPGAGKGTQAELIVNRYNLVHISTGDLFREAISKKSELGVLANSYISKGNLVPDEVTIGLVKERLQKADCKNGFILDGFPRTLPQAECLEEICKELNIRIDNVLDIEVKESCILERITGRQVCSKCGASYHKLFRKPVKEGICDNCGGTLYVRNDDTSEAVTTRLQAYNNQTKPLIDFYTKRGVLVKIDGNLSRDDVFKGIVARLG